MPRRNLLVALFSIIAIGLLFPMYQVKSQADAETTQRQTELSRVSHELNQVRLVVDELKELEAAIDEITADAEALEQSHHGILGIRGSFTNNLKLVTGALPSETYFTYIDIGAGQINVEGETDSPFTVVSYAMALEILEKLSEIRITAIGEATAAATEVTENQATEVAYNMITFNIVINQ